MEENRPILARFQAGYQIDNATGCWNWQRGKCSHGYGMIWDSGQNRGAHRVSFELHREPIPDGLQIDHLCRNRGCVNPDHLEPVTQQENILRGASFIAKQVAQTHCSRGHELNAENTYVRKSGQRQCRVCHRQRMHQRRRA